MCMSVHVDMCIYPANNTDNIFFFIIFLPFLKLCTVTLTATDFLYWYLLKRLTFQIKGK